MARRSVPNGGRSRDRIQGVVAGIPAQSYSRGQVCRLTGAGAAQLRQWERRGYLPPGEYGYLDLVAVQALLRMKSSGLRPARIARVIETLRARLQGIASPLHELKIFTDAGRVTVLVDGQKMEALSGQLLFDFDQEELNRLLKFPGGDPEGRRKRQERRAAAVEWFHRGLEMEQTGAPVEHVIDAYAKAVELDEGCIGALVNLGTIHFHAQQWEEAETCYRRALAADPEYALAHFNLGNLFDERGDLAQAVVHYLSALRVNANYSDAHYNLALLYQRQGEWMKAVRHWKAYLKLDPASEWAEIARRELEKVRAAAVVEGTGRSGAPQPARTKGHS